MGIRFVFGALILAVACPSAVFAGGGIVRVAVPGPLSALPVVLPGLELAVLSPGLSRPPALVASILAAPAAPAPTPVPAAVRGMEAMMLRDLARDRAQRAEEAPTSALDEAKALAATAAVRPEDSGRAPWISEALLLRDLRRDEPRRRAIVREQAVYRKSMARVERERRR